MAYSTDNLSRAHLQLEAALLAANKYAVITEDERARIRQAFDKLSQDEQEAFLDGHLERPLQGLSAEKREKLIALMHNILSRVGSNKN